jgi:large subunit ribosomal protein L21
MYAVIKSGGKQYKVEQGQVIKLEKLPVESGKEITLDEVLMVANGDNIQVGAPVLVGAKVKGEVVEQGRHRKVEVIKFKRRKHHMKRQGHRQYFTAVKITGIEMPA